MLLKAFTFHAEICHETSGKMMRVRAVLGIWLVCPDALIASLTALQAELAL
jgi:hypothetical protein